MGVYHIENLNVNLDGTWPEELDEMAKAFDLLAAYARTKAGAMRDRAAGRIVEAIAQEGQCEAYYHRLPKWARW